VVDARGISGRRVARLGERRLRRSFELRALQLGVGRVGGELELLVADRSCIAFDSALVSGSVVPVQRSTRPLQGR
jgi:hypothetical protein